MTCTRMHLFEFEDLSWLPNTFREAITDLLTYQISHFGIYNAAAPKIAEILQKTSQNSIFDLCSGSGGPAIGVQQEVSKILEKNIHLTLSDKYPNLKVFSQIKAPNVRAIPESVDVIKAFPKAPGLYTMFTAFHHFKPLQARAILQNAVDAKMPIAIFEITERKAQSLMTLLVAPLTCLYFTLFLKPFKLSRFIWTYLLPIIPILYTWDGLISNLRSYTKDEWLKMTKELNDDDFIWETGELISKFHIKVFYLIGYPKNKTNPTD